MNNEKWTEIIGPRTGWFDLKLAELWRYRDLIIMFVRRDFTAQYKQTILGPLWFFIAPLFTVYSYTLVFSRIANISTDGIPGPLFYMAGTTMWNYFQTCFTTTANTFVGNAAIFGKVYFPRLATPISVVISNLVKFSLQIGLFMIMWLYYYAQGAISINYCALLFPALLLMMAAIGLGFGILFSSMTTKYRDLNFVLNFCVTLLMYVTPIIYPSSVIPETYRAYLFLNPLSHIMEAFRHGFTGGGAISWIGLGYSALFSVVILFSGLIAFNQTEKTFMDTV